MTPIWRGCSYFFGLPARQTRGADGNSAEWAYVVEGDCQVTVLDPAGNPEVANLGPGDLWYFPKGHSHAIQTLGTKPCYAILAFDDGLYSEHGTFGLSDWMSRFDEEALAQAFGVSKEAMPPYPTGETYIMQGEVVALDSPQARATQELDVAKSHRCALMAKGPAVSMRGGTSISCRPHNCGAFRAQTTGVSSMASSGF